MPEGPEVTIISENLNSLLQGKEILSIEITDTSRYRNKSPDNYNFFIDNLPLKVKKVENKGKLIYFTFQKNIFLLNTLGMSGVWKKKKEKHTSVIIEYKDKNTKKLYFVDQRHFGTLKFLTSKEELEKKLNQIGPDMLNDKKMSFQLFNKRLQKYKNYNIVKALMDQKVVSGVGNYLKSESLYHARICPYSKIEELSQNELYRLYQSIRLKIVGSYNQGGVSVKNFADVDDKKGQFHFRFEVYCRKRDPYGNKVEKIVLADKRSTYYVPVLQLCCCGK